VVRDGNSNFEPGAPGGGFAGNLTTQGLNVLSGRQCDIRATDLAFATAVGGLLGKFGSVTADGISAGRNSYNAIFNQISTKFANGTISEIAPATAVKMFIGRGTATGFFGSAPVSGALNAVWGSQ
jgi:hypothetical protein